MKTILLTTALIAACAVATSCTSCENPLLGTYYGETGSIVLELKSGGNARLTLTGQSDKCTYSVKGNQLTLVCKGESGALPITIEKDGSLIPSLDITTTLRKRK